MTIQEIFDKVYTHLLTQNAKSQDNFEGLTSCKYRSAEGLMCAVGCLITDEAYNKDIEGKNPKTKLVRKTLEKSGITVDPNTARILADLQTIHDVFEPEYWEEELSIFAQNKNLTVPTLKG